MNSNTDHSIRVRGTKIVATDTSKQYREKIARIAMDEMYLDLSMPEISGIQCLAKLKNHTDYKDIPVVMYSTSFNPRDQEIAIEFGALGILPKPSDFKILIEILSRIANTETADLKKVLREIVN